jgi:hypothetical protein
VNVEPMRVLSAFGGLNTPLLLGKLDSRLDHDLDSFKVWPPSPKFEIKVFGRWVRKVFIYQAETFPVRCFGRHIAPPGDKTSKAENGLQRAQFLDNCKPLGSQFRMQTSFRQHSSCEIPFAP